MFFDICSYNKGIYILIVSQFAQSEVSVADDESDEEESDAAGALPTPLLDKVPVVFSVEPFIEGASPTPLLDEVAVVFSIETGASAPFQRRPGGKGELADAGRLRIGMRTGTSSSRACTASKARCRAFSSCCHTQSTPPGKSQRQRKPEASCKYHPHITHLAVAIMREHSNNR